MLTPSGQPSPVTQSGLAALWLVEEILVSWHKKLSQTWRPKPTGIPPQSWRPELQNEGSPDFVDKKKGCLQGHPSSRGSWENLFFASSSPWRLQVFHGLRLRRSNLSLHRHTTSSSPECLSKLPLPLSCKDVCDCIEGPPDSPGKMPPLQICNWITVSAKWGPFTSSRALTQISVERSFSAHNRRVKTLGSLWPTPHHHGSQD